MLRVVPPATTRVAPRAFTRALSQSYRIKRVLNLPASLMYDVVGDVEQYQEFVPYCKRSHVTAHENGHPSRATLIVGWDAIEDEFESKLTYTPTTVVAEAANNKMFKELKCEWSVKPVQDDKCLADLKLTFAFQNNMYNLVSKAAGPAVSRAMIQAFSNRAQEIANM